jgi:hypothetical protein
VKNVDEMSRQPRTLIQPQLRNNAYASCVDKVCDEADYGADDDDLETST